MTSNYESAVTLSEVAAATERILHGELTPYTGALNLCARTYAEMKRRNAGFDYLEGMRHQVAVLVGGYLSFPESEVTTAVTSNVIDHWVTRVRRNSDW